MSAEVRGDLPADLLIHLGRLAEWLKSEPSGKTENSSSYFFVAEVRVCVDVESETVGRFVYVDDHWCFEVSA